MVSKIHFKFHETYTKKEKEKNLSPRSRGLFNILTLSTQSS